MKNKYTNLDIIKKFKEIHGTKYCYNNFIYTKMHDKSIICCPIHGDFEQTPHSHLKGQGCPICGIEQRSKKRLFTTEDFIKKAKEIHGDKYDYSKVNYINSQTKVCIICPEHGEFWQKPNCHLQKQGCPDCYNSKRKIIFNHTIKDFIKKAIEVHGDKYDYSKVNYTNNHTKVCIICPEHGEFWQTPGMHTSEKQGCPECGKLTISQKRTQTTKDFIEKAKRIHGNKYDYSKTIYLGTNTKVKIICPKHGEFEQYPYYHLGGCGCQQCAKEIKSSQYEIEIMNFIISLNVLITPNDRKIIHPMEIDGYMSEINTAFEFNGIYWHSEIYQKDKNYHLNKLEECNKQGIKLIHIFEDEYLEHKDIVLSKIKHIIGKDDDLPKIFARKCNIKEINSTQAKDFLDKNHIQGFVASTIYLGCYHNNELIAVMTFKEEKKDNNRWELNRFATDNNKHCIGVGGKLFKYFIRNYNPSYIKSFADRRWTLDKDNNLYTKLGFKLEEILKPDYRYVKGNKREHKFGYRKQILMKKYPEAGLTMDMTEKEMTEKLGFYRIWDCGLFKYAWENNKVL